MAIVLILCILFSSLLLVILKSFVRWEIDTLHALIFNYYTAALCAFFFGGESINYQFGDLKPVWLICFLTGSLFISVFFLIARTAQKSGVAVASVASKMSMVIPVSAGLLLYNESLHINKALGILLAIPAVLLSSYSGAFLNKSSTDKRYFSSKAGLPILLFLGAGLVDTAIKFTQHYFMNEQNRPLMIMAIFASAGIVGSIKVFYDIITFKKYIAFKSIAGGIILGIFNYLSLHYLLKGLEYPGSESSRIFSMVNIGVIICSSLFAWFIFHEKWSRFKITGIIIAIISISLLAY
jgi:drug/metabolite transporter (DMT)-like permease